MVRSNLEKNGQDVFVTSVNLGNINGSLIIKDPFKVFNLSEKKFHPISFDANMKLFHFDRFLSLKK